MLPCLTPHGRLFAVGFFPPSIHPIHPISSSSRPRCVAVNMQRWRYWATTDRFVLGLAHLLPLARAADSNFSTAAYPHISTLGRPTVKREPSPLPPALGSTCASTSYLRDRDWNSAVLPPLALLSAGAKVAVQQSRSRGEDGKTK